jgi:adenylate cyclase
LLREKIDSLLVRYIGEETRDELVQRNSEITSMRIKTVILYCDIRNFTALSEKADASDVVSMLNYYYGQWHETIKKFHGTINKFIGDALLSFFDSKTSLSENAVFAVQAACTMLKQQKRMNQELAAKGLPTIEKIGIGIHCGEVILGDIGGERKDYTLIGDTVNTAARLESLCKTSNTSLIISDACYILLNEELKKQFSTISTITLRGKEDPLKLYGLNQN